MSDAENNDIKPNKSLFGTDTNPSNIVPNKLFLDSEIKFRCHPKVSCFTACCGNINIILTPYDILRIRKELNMSADEFLLRFTKPVFLEKTDMPGVKLNLDENGRCPFVTEKGCTIYPHRPTTCRLSTRSTTCRTLPSTPDETLRFVHCRLSLACLAPERNRNRTPMGEPGS